MDHGNGMDHHDHMDHDTMNDTHRDHTDHSHMNHMNHMDHMMMDHGAMSGGHGDMHSMMVSDWHYLNSHLLLLHCI